ncbi:hypothetical protein RsoM2USA_73 [Ralstonia phage RsoM2USA]|nr:hypothetical protein RsoM2USA_73 [Ralstonia phage RsoM2USA]
MWISDNHRHRMRHRNYHCTVHNDERFLHHGTRFFLLRDDYRLCYKISSIRLDFYVHTDHLHGCRRGRASIRSFDISSKSRKDRDNGRKRSRIHSSTVYKFQNENLRKSRVQVKVNRKSQRDSYESLFRYNLAGLQFETKI